LPAPDLEKLGRSKLLWEQVVVSTSVALRGYLLLGDEVLGHLGLAFQPCEARFLVDRGR
jgi:hypothetical protein